MLAGWLFIAYPIWLHFKTRKVVILPFPAFLLLSETAKTRKPKLRLRKLLLLLSRILLILFAAAAAAGPTVTVIRPGGIRTGAPTALVIVLDNSMSMRLEDENGETLFDKAKAIAKTELDRLRPGDAAALITTCEPRESSVARVDFDIVQSQNALESTEVTFRPGRLKQQLMRGLRLLEDCPLTEREVLLISDLNEGKDLNMPLLPPASGMTLRIVDAGPDVQRDNTAVSDVRAHPSSGSTQREMVVETTVHNYSNSPKKGVNVVLEIEGREAARGAVDLPALGFAVKRFFHRFQNDGVFRGSVRIPSDRLKADDRCHFSVSVSRAVSVLIIDGDFRPGSYHDEAFYLKRALETPSPGEVPIVTSLTDVDSALKAPITGNDVVFLAGVPSLPTLPSGRLIQFVRKGGGLILTPDEQSGKFDELESILPATVRSVRQAPRTRPFTIGGINRAHAIFEPFDEGQTGLEKVEILRHLEFDSSLAGDASVLIETKDAHPLMLERRVDRGIVMVLGVTADRAWSDLPIRPGFLPLMQRSVRRAAGRLDDRSQKPVEAGRPVAIEVSEGMQRLTVRAPDEKDTVFSAKELDGKSHVMFYDTNTPGEYAVWTEIPRVGGLREMTALGFPVITNPSESDLSRKIAATADDRQNRFADAAGLLPIWPYLLLAAMLLALAETVVAALGMRRSHVKTPDSTSA
jgi:hypothetical protein